MARIEVELLIKEDNIRTKRILVVTVKIQDQ